MITETLDHDRDIGVGLVISLPHEEQLFFFYLYMSFKKETEDRPIHKCHKNAQVRSKHQIVQDVVYLCTCLLYILLYIYLYLCTGSI